MRELLVVRHAIALDHLEAYGQGVEDEQRPLTDAGIEKMELAAQGIARQNRECALILTSPLLRAGQTAAILNGVYPGSRLETAEQLAPGHSVREVIATLQGFDEERIAIVGHEPGLSALVATLLCGQCGGTLQLKKGGAALLRFGRDIKVGGGILLWLATPGQLRLQGRAG